jgi:hypothetical protein
MATSGIVDQAVLVMHSEDDLKKRMIEGITIICDIEKTQTKLTVAMMETSFQTEDLKKKYLIVEIKFLRKDWLVRSEETPLNSKNGTEILCDKFCQSEYIC